MLLAVDCCSHLCSAGIYDPHTDKIRASCSEDIGRGHSEYLMETIDKCLIESGLKYADLTTLAVTNGPGSFTGVRVGLAAVKGLALALDIPIVGISSLEACAHHAMGLEPCLPTDVRIIAVLDARREQAWVQTFIPCAGIPVSAGNPFMVSYHDHFMNIEAKTVLCGSGAVRLAKERINHRDSIIIIHELSAMPIAGITKLAIKKPIINQPVHPLYLRSPDAKPQIAPSFPDKYVIKTST